MSNQVDQHGSSAPVSDTTRYLSAAAYLDEKFAKETLESTIYERHRSIAVSPGVQLAPILRHCVAARRRQIIRDGLLTVGVAAILYAVVTVNLRLFILSVLLAWFVVLVEMATARYDVVARTLRPDNDRRGTPSISGSRAELIDDMHRRQAGNVVVYSGFSPFVGSGIEVEGWSFAINTSIGRETLTGERADPQEFTSAELYEQVARELMNLDIGGLSIRERAYVHGQDVAAMSVLLPDIHERPVSNLPTDILRQFRDSSSQVVRYYLCVEVQDWRGELVFTLFFRLRLVSETLFVEASFFLLPPLVEQRHAVDRLRSVPSLIEVAALFGRSLLKTVSGLALAVPRIIKRMIEPLHRVIRERSDQLRISSDGLFDYGALRSTREKNTSSEYRRYFQKLDKEMYAKTIERLLFDTMASFLDSRDIDTSAFNERRSTILNNGVMVTGGSFSAGSVAAGKKAKATQPGGGATN